jgi:hypothetical protein
MRTTKTLPESASLRGTYFLSAFTTRGLQLSFLRGTYGPRSSSKDAFAARREFPSEDPSTRALADDNEVVAFAGVHCDDSSAKATFHYSPTRKKLPVNLL